MSTYEQMIEAVTQFNQGHRTHQGTSNKLEIAFPGDGTFYVQNSDGERVSDIFPVAEI